MKRVLRRLAGMEEKTSAMREAGISKETPRPAASRLGRWLLAGAGVVSVGLAALGAVLPGLPTTIFLIVASWCFARSCPWLEERLVRTPLFRPFLGYLDGARMPLKAVIVTLAVMWTAVAVSTAMLLGGDTRRPLVAAIVVVAAAVGSVFVVRLRARGAGEPAGRHQGLAPTDA